MPNPAQDAEDADLIVVAALEEYSRRHGLDTHEAYALFQDAGVFASIRSGYDVLHTLDLDEAADYADDCLEASQRG
jgi:hypothetical protein